MQFLVLATDYDGTLAADGQVSPSTLAALKRWKESARKLVMVTGRCLNDLLNAFPHLDLFEAVVAENGALLYFPATQEEQVLGDRPPAAFVAQLQTQNVKPLSIGKVIVATWEPYEEAVRQTIHDQGLALQIIFNKGAVMVLPAGINKATGLSAALSKLSLSRHNTVAIGDAENDRAFLEFSGYAVAVANALPSLKEKVDWVTEGSRGDGVVELIDRLLDTDP